MNLPTCYLHIVRLFIVRYDRGRKAYMSSYLFATPKVVDGIASLVDLFGVYSMYDESPTACEADRRAITSDMQALQQDANIVFSRFQEKHQQQTAVRQGDY